MKNTFILTIGLSLTTMSFGQTPVNVADNTQKIGAFGEKVFYYGFAEGDQLIFNFQEVNGKALKEVEIIELPSSSKFMDYKTNKIENKTLIIARTGIYKFRLSNAAINGRICKVKIQRIPVSDTTKNFNSSVYWKTVYDTTYTTEQEKYLIRADTTISNLTDQVAKVHSKGSLNGSTTTLNFILPQNTVSWSYYIGVDQAGQQAYENAAKELATKATPLASLFQGYGLLAALAFGSAPYIATLQKGEDIDFQFISTQTEQSFKKGKVLNDFSQMKVPLFGGISLCLSNDNAIRGVSVTVKITAIVVTEQWGQRPVQIQHISSQQVAYLKH